MHEKFQIYFKGSFSKHAEKVKEYNKIPKKEFLDISKLPSFNQKKSKEMIRLNRQKAVFLQIELLFKQSMRFLLPKTRFHFQFYLNTSSGLKASFILELNPLCHLNQVAFYIGTA